MASPLPRPGILDIKPYIGGNAAIPKDKPIINLASNESPLGPSPLAIKAFQQQATRLHRYPDGSSKQLRQAIAEHQQLPAEQIVCANGSERLIDLLARAYAGPGDEILFSQYGFLMYPICTLATGATPVSAAEIDYVANIDNLLSAVTEKTRIVFLANPNNPTGTYLGIGEIQRLQQALPATTLLVLDAAYTEYVTAADYQAGHELVAEHANVVVLRTFSKLYGLAAVRLGWAHCPAAVADVLNRIRGSFNVTAPAQAAGSAALQDIVHQQQAQHHNQQWLPWLSKQLNSLGISVTPSVANFVLAHFSDRNQCQTVYQQLFNQGILVRPMDSYNIPTALRITVGTAAENQQLIYCLKQILSN